MPIDLRDDLGEDPSVVDRRWWFFWALHLFIGSCGPESNDRERQEAIEVARNRQQTSPQTTTNTSTATEASSGSTASTGSPTAPTSSSTGAALTCEGAYAANVAQSINTTCSGCHVAASGNFKLAKDDAAGNLAAIKTKGFDTIVAKLNSGDALHAAYSGIASQFTSLKAACP